jgi:hypothetical protein
MATPPLVLAEIARDLARVSQALCHALETGEFDAAEHLIMKRGLLLDAAEAAPWPTDPDELAAIFDARQVVADTAARCEAAVRRSIGAAQGALSDLGTGARAMHAYLGGGPLASGWVDRRD